MFIKGDTLARPAPIRRKKRQESRPEVVPEAKPAISASAWRYGWLAAILLFAAFLRFYELGTVPPGIAPDEGMEGSNALEALETHHFQVFYPENNGREGLYANAVAASVALFGNTKFALRLPAAVAGTLTVAGLYCLAAELFPVEVALAASFLLAASFWHLVASRMAGHAILAPLFLTWTLFFLVRGLRHGAQGWWAAATVLAGGICFGLGFHTYAPFRITPLVIGLVLAVEGWRARAAGRLRPFAWLAAVYLGSAALVALPLAWYFVEHPAAMWQRASQVSVWNASNPAVRVLANAWTTAQMFFYEGDRNWRHNFAGERELFWPVALLFALGCWMAVRELRAGGDDKVWLRAIVGPGWLAAAAIPVVLSDEGLPHALRSLLMAPAVFLLAGVGAVGIYDWAKAKEPGYVLRLAFPLLAIGLAIQPYYLYFESWAKRPEVASAYYAVPEDVADEINRLPDQTPKYVVLLSQANLPVRGIPLMAQPIEYLTGSFTATGRARRQIYYVTEENAASLGIAQAQGKSLCQSVSEGHPEARTFCL